MLVNWLKTLSRTTCTCEMSAWSSSAVFVDEQTVSSSDMTILELIKNCFGNNSIIKRVRDLRFAVGVGINWQQKFHLFEEFVPVYRSTLAKMSDKMIAQCAPLSSTFRFIWKRHDWISELVVSERYCCMHGSTTNGIYVFYLMKIEDKNRFLCFLAWNTKFRKNGEQNHRNQMKLTPTASKTLIHHICYWLPHFSTFRCIFEVGMGGVVNYFHTLDKINQQ